jgi:hypothetical protein
VTTPSRGIHPPLLVAGHHDRGIEPEPPLQQTLHKTGPAIGGIRLKPANVAAEASDEASHEERR